MKPSDFFVSVIDFLGILLPGAVLLSIHGNLLLKRLDGSLPIDGQSSHWIVFLVLSYIIGQFLLGIGVRLNDLDERYSPKKKDKYYQEVKSEIQLPEGVETRRDTYYRAYSFVRLMSAAAIAEVDRQTAEYKFFRSLTIVFLLDIPLAWASGSFNWPRALIAFILALLSLWRFLFLLDWSQRLTFEFYHLIKKESSTIKAATTSSSGAG
jgi:hypothetical protein